MRVAELIRQENGQFLVLDTRVPPVLEPLARRRSSRTACAACSRNIVARQQQLFARAPPAPDTAASSSTSARARTFWLLHTLNAAIPELNHLLDTPRAHPEEAYVDAGAPGRERWPASRPTPSPCELPKFNYLELGEAFEALFADRAAACLPGGIERSYVEIPLEHRPDGMFIGRIADPKLSWLTSSSWR